MIDTPINKSNEEVLEALDLYKQQSLLIELEKEFYLEFDSEYKDLVNYMPRSEYPIHRWFKYREGYSVDLIDNLISNNEKKILDPFCGCGSTLVAAKKRSVDSVGVDINPLSIFVSKVKTQNYSKEDLLKIKKTFNSIINDLSNDSIKKPHLSIIDKAFHPTILQYLLKLKYRINQIEDALVREFILLAYMAILESASNTFKEGNGIKYKFTKRTNSGYTQLPLEKWYDDYYPQNKIEFVNNKFKAKVEQMIEDILNTNYPFSSVELITGDSTNLDLLVDHDSFSLCTFSPPYCNCFDYFEIFKLELWLGEFIQNYSELRALRRNSLRSNTNTRLEKDTTNFSFLENFIELIDKDRLWDKKLFSVIRGYFTDMEKTLLGISNSLIENGKCFIIVANSAYGGVIIPTDILLAKIAKESGFEVNRIIIARNITTSSQQQKKLFHLKKYMRESIVCLEKV